MLCPMPMKSVTSLLLAMAMSLPSSWLSAAAPIFPQAMNNTVNFTLNSMPLHEHLILLQHARHHHSYHPSSSHSSDGGNGGHPSHMDCGAAPLCGVMVLESGYGEGLYGHTTGPVVHGLWPETGSFGTSQCIKPSKSAETPTSLSTCYVSHWTILNLFTM